MYKNTLYYYWPKRRHSKGAAGEREGRICLMAMPIALHDAAIRGMRIWRKAELAHVKALGQGRDPFAAAHLLFKYFSFEFDTTGKFSEEAVGAYFGNGEREFDVSVE